MNTIFINKADEDWIVDRFRDEWESYNPAYLNNDINKSDIIWIIAPWNTKNIDLQLLNDKKVVCTIHHIDIEKFKEEKDFINLINLLIIIMLYQRKQRKFLNNLQKNLLALYLFGLIKMFFLMRIKRTKEKVRNFK